MMRRLKNFEAELTRMLAHSRDNSDLRPMLTSFAKMLGEEIDYIEKNASSDISTVSAAGGLIVGTSTGTSLVGYMANEASLIAGANVITFTTPFTVPFVLGVLRCTGTIHGEIVQVEWKINPTDVLPTQFTITVDMACTLQYFAIPTI